MKTRTLLLMAAAISLVAGTGFAFAADDADDEGDNDQTYRDQPNAPAPDQSMTDQGYSQHWFSSTGYGPHDDQADETRALNRQALGAEHEGTSPGRDGDEDDMQGPSDEAAPPDADEDDDEGDAPPPATDR